MTTIDVNAILERLRQAHEGSSEATTATMTLLVYTDDTGRIGRLRERARSIVEKFPARMVLLDATSGPLHHDVQTISAEIDRHNVARAEWIELGVQGVPPHEVSAIARAFLLHEVPAVLLWFGHAMMRDPAFLALNDVADSLMLDSSRLEQDTSALRQLTEYFAQDRRYAVQDFAYLRLAPWQEMIAEFFDEPELAAELQELRNVTIVTGSQAEAYYLLGWLESRLGWRCTGSNAFSYPSGAQVAFDVRLEGIPRRVRSIELRSSGTLFRAALKEGSDDKIVCLTVEGAKTRPVHCEPLHDISNLDLLERAILMPKTSDVYRETLEAVRTILLSAQA